MMKSVPRSIEVYAHWAPIVLPLRMGILHAIPAKGKEVFSFSYDPDQIIRDVIHVVKGWRDVATSIGIGSSEQGLMEFAFRIAEGAV